MELVDLITEDDALSNEEKTLLLKISSLAKLIGYVGYAYAVYITFFTLYKILSLADNSKMWIYYKTIPGFINILVIIISGLLYWFISLQVSRFGGQLNYALKHTRQEKFESAWRHFNLLLLILNSLVVLWLIATLITGLSGNF